MVGCIYFLSVGSGRCNCQPPVYRCVVTGPVTCGPPGRRLSRPAEASQGCDDKAWKKEERNATTSGKPFCKVSYFLVNGLGLLKYHGKEPEHLRRSGFSLIIA